MLLPLLALMLQGCSISKEYGLCHARTSQNPSLTGTFKESKRSPNIGRAEALRRSMIAMIEGKNKKLAHPEYWSPFILVGEGAR